MSIGDLLSDQQRNKLWQSSFRPFQVFSVEVGEAILDRERKYCILVCMVPECGAFLINSGICNSIRKNSKKLELQVFLPHSSNKFLPNENGSYIECSNLIDVHFDKTTIDNLLSGRGRYVGTIDETSQQQVIEAVKRSKILSNKRRREILSYLID